MTLWPSSYPLHEVGELALLLGQDVDLGSGRITASETEAANLFANSV
jgi:hypothetical protein